MIIQSNSPEETMHVAEAFAQELVGGEVIALEGVLGAGKTCFAQGVAQALGVTDPVRSPTFTLVNTYPISHKGIRLLVHADLYRLEDSDDGFSLGLQDYLGQEGVVTLVEWPERMKDMVTPTHRVQCWIEGDTHIIEIKKEAS